MDVSYALLAPVSVLVIWTLIMLFVAAYRITKGVKSAGKIEGLPKNPRGRDLDGKIDEAVTSSRQNYEHLVEQPTLFYAVVISLAVIGADHPINVGLAWGYVALRIGHSLAQSLGKGRAFWFLSSTLVLLALAIHLAMEVVHHL